VATVITEVITINVAIMMVMAITIVAGKMTTTAITITTMLTSHALVVIPIRST
jgi:hypothetical protein